MFHGFPQTTSLTEGGKVAISPLPEILAASKCPAVPWAGEVVERKEGKQPSARCGPLPPHGLQGAGPTALLSQRGGVRGSDGATRRKGCQQGGLLGSEGGCPSLGSQAGAGEATHPPWLLSGPRLLWDRGVVAGRALCYSAANGRTAEAAAANRSVGLH